MTTLNDEIYEIEHSTITHESDSDSDSESDNESDNKSNVDNPKTIPRHFGPKNFDLSKIKKGDMVGPKWKNDSKNDQDEGLKRVMK